MNNGQLRPARMSDVRAIHGLLQGFADQGLLLPRSISSLYDQLRDFIVYDAGGIKGVCSLHICWDNLAEIRSLAVAGDLQGRGIGSLLVRSCLDEAASLEIEQVFVLTYQADFFRTIGFVDKDKRDLPHKIWSDCLNCPKFPDCDEESLIWIASKKNYVITTKAQKTGRGDAGDCSAMSDMARSAGENVTPRSGVTRKTCRMGIAHQK